MTVKVLGLRELGESMRLMKSEISTKIARGMTNAGAQVVKKAAISNVVASPAIDTGSLRDAIIVKRMPKGEATAGLTSEHIVTVRRKASGRKTKTKQLTAPHARFVEFGTVNMPPEPFLRPALAENVTKATEAMRDYGKKRVEAAAKKANKGPKR